MSVVGKGPTFNAAAPLIEKLVRPISSGDIAKSFDATDEEGRPIHLSDDHLSGKPLILVFLNNPVRNVAIEVLRNFADRYWDFRDRKATILAIHSNSDATVNQSLKVESKFPWPILGDASGVIHAKYGLLKNHGETLRVVVLTRYRQIRCWYDGPKDLKLTVDSIMTQLIVPNVEDNGKWYPVHAPILIVPAVFSNEECRELIEIVENRGDLYVAVGPAGDLNTDFKIPVYEHNRQDRIDHVIRDEAIIKFIDQRFGERINPMIEKAFSFRVTRRESLHIARYVGLRGGNQMGHRDNTSQATIHRRFAFSMNLNDDYRGGGIVFGEFNDHSYRTDPGTALIFSSSLLHEVEETSSGTRYSLITHLFDDATVPTK